MRALDLKNYRTKAYCVTNFNCALALSFQNPSVTTYIVYAYPVRFKDRKRDVEKEMVVNGEGNKKMHRSGI